MEKILEKFKNHKATRIMKEDIEHVIWSSGSCFYYIEYIFIGRTMLIKGDCGTAVFEFTEKASSEKIVDYKDWNYYVMSKYSCSDFDKEDLDKEQFQKDIDWWKKDREDLENIKNTKRILWEIFENSNSIQSYETELAIRINNDELEYDEDSFWGYGRKRANEFDVMFKGLELAVEQLRKGENNGNNKDNGVSKQ